MKHALISLLALFATTAFAADGSLSTLKFDPAQPKAGQPVKITVGVDGTAPGFCGLIVRFGDGSDKKFKIDGMTTTLPLTVEKVFAKGGTYTVKAEGKKVTSHFPCDGSVEQQVIVEAAAVGQGTAAADVCPEGYKLKGKVGQSGEFSCTAGKGAKKPEKVLNCADGLEYFQTKSTVGCQWAADAAPAAPAAPACPDGYKLKGKVGKAGDFSCTAGKGALAPEKVLSCNDGLEYFQTKSTLGCRLEKK